MSIPTFWTDVEAVPGRVRWGEVYWTPSDVEPAYRSSPYRSAAAFVIDVSDGRRQSRRILVGGADRANEMTMMLTSTMRHSSNYLTALAVVAWSLGATVSAGAQDGANGPNGNGAGAPTIANQSLLHGGDGGDGTDGGSGGSGGIGALVTGGGQSSNVSAISGGLGGAGGNCVSVFFCSGVAGGAGGAGGAGAFFAGSGATFTNSGAVTGGTGGGGGSNTNFFGGGAAGGVGGAGVSFAAGGAEFVNAGKVTGGTGGAGGSSVFGGEPGRVGGAGVSFEASGAMFTNTGTVTGGAGGFGGFARAGEIGGAGGTAVSFAASGASFMNTGAVIGGGGSSASIEGKGGAGGAAVSFAPGGATFTNSGAVTGGVGGSALFGGAGGAGASFAAGGATFTNTGVVTGGAGGGGIDGGIGGVGGGGVVGAGLTIVNSGVISGGLSGDGVSRADAIDFTGGANVLELRAGSTITGNVVGTGADLLRLGGSVNSAFDASALGTQYQDFGGVEKSGASAWTVTGSTNVSAPWAIDQGMLILNGSIANASLTTVNSGATLAGVGGVGNLLVAGGGTFAPGFVGGQGTMMVAGNLAFQPASTYSVQLAGAVGSRANVSGAALLNGTLVTTLAPGASLTKSYDVLHADGGLGDTHFAAFNDPPNLLESLSYGQTTCLSI